MKSWIHRLIWFKLVKSHLFFYNILCKWRVKLHQNDMNFCTFQVWIPKISNYKSYYFVGSCNFLIWIQFENLLRKNIALKKNFGPYYFIHSKIISFIKIHLDSWMNIHRMSPVNYNGWNFNMWKHGKIKSTK
jgi:hypothetical protein